MTVKKRLSRKKVTDQGLGVTVMVLKNDNYEEQIKEKSYRLRVNDSR